MVIDGWIEVTRAEPENNGGLVSSTSEYATTDTRAPARASALPLLNMLGHDGVVDASRAGEARGGESCPLLPDDVDGVAALPMR